MLASGYLFDGDTSHITSTIIEAETTDLDSSSCIIVSLPTTDSLTVIGLVIRGGRGTTWHGPSDDWVAGGGIFADASRVCIEYSRVVDCRAQRGGGIANLSLDPDSAEGSLRLQSCKVQNCYAELYGGGVFTFQSSADLQFCTMAACTSQQSAGGVHTGGFATMNSCTLRQCGGIWGGAMLESHNSIVENCLFEENGNPQSSQFFGSCNLLVAGNVITRHCIFRNNTTNDAAVVIHDFPRFGIPFFFGNVIEFHTMTDRIGAVYLWNCQGEFSYNVMNGCYAQRGASIVPSGSVFFHHNAFWGNGQDGNDGGSVFCFNNQGLTPGRIDSNMFEGNIGTVFYRDNSIPNPPTLNARNNWWGDASGPYHPVLNPDGQGDTILITGVEIEPWLTEPPDTTLSGVDPRSLPQLGSTWKLLSVYPNPFNSTLRIELAGFTGMDFNLSLYDILGRKQTELHSGRLFGGTLTFEAPVALASGIYFLRASDATTAETRKVVFMK